MQFCTFIVPRQSLRKRALPCISCSWGKQTNTQCLQTDRQTWAQLFTSVNTVFTVKYMGIYFYLFAFVREAWDMETDRDSYELSTCTQARVWKMLLLFAGNLPDVAYTYQTRNLQSHTLLLLCRGLKIILTLEEKRITPSPKSNMERFSVCTVSPWIMSCFLSLSRFLNANAEWNKTNFSSSCRQAAANHPDICKRL